MVAFEHVLIYQQRKFVSRLATKFYIVLKLFQNYVRIRSISLSMRLKVPSKFPYTRHYVKRVYFFYYTVRIDAHHERHIATLYSALHMGLHRAQLVHIQPHIFCCCFRRLNIFSFREGIAQKKLFTLSK